MAFEDKACLCIWVCVSLVYCESKTLSVVPLSFSVAVENSHWGLLDSIHKLLKNIDTQHFIDGGQLTHTPDMLVYVNA